MRGVQGQRRPRETLRLLWRCHRERPTGPVAESYLSNMSDGGHFGSLLGSFPQGGSVDPLSLPFIPVGTSWHPVGHHPCEDRSPPASNAQFHLPSEIARVLACTVDTQQCIGGSITPAMHGIVPWRCVIEHAQRFAHPRSLWLRTSVARVAPSTPRLSIIETAHPSGRNALAQSAPMVRSRDCLATH